MTKDVVLHGYDYSVYTRSVRMAFYMKGISVKFENIDPFDPVRSDDLSRLHPFLRVPVLQVGDFRLYETQAILDYVDAGFDGPDLTPVSAEAKGRMRQVMGIADSYLYWPLVRQAFSNRVFGPLVGEAGDAAEIASGLAAAPTVLDALEEIAGEGLVLQPAGQGLEACHLWPMLDYARMVPEVARMLELRPALSAWVKTMQAHPTSVATKPDLSALKG